MALLLAGLYLLLRSPKGHSRDEFPWQPPIEPNGVMIRESGATNLPPSKLASAPEEQPSPASSARQQASPATPAVATGNTPPANPPDPTPQVRQAIERWSQAWSGRNVNAYLEAYARSFVPENGQGKPAWEQTRRQRILSKSAISHEVRDLQITLEGSKAVARFEQTYTADHVRSVGPKTLRLELEGDKWLIVSESTH